MIWISGPPRSGTTMLNLMLAGRQYLPECTIITRLIGLYALCENERDRRYKTFMGEGAALRRNFESIVNTGLRDTPKDAVLKDPYLCLYFQEWRDLFPNDPMIVIIRNPLDAVTSMLGVLRRTDANARVSRAIDFMAPFYAAIDRIPENSNNVLVVRYEDLVMRAAKPVEKLRQFAGRELQGLSDSRPIDTPYLPGQSDPFYSPLYGRPLTDRRIGVHRDLLTRYELDVVSEAFGDVVERRFKDFVGEHNCKRRLGLPAFKLNRELTRLGKNLVRWPRPSSARG